jgi:uncharacterized repeat protein (TIGR01451 family)
MGVTGGAWAQTAESAITIQRVVVPALYTPGQVINVTVTMQKNDPRDVQAIALVDTLPAAWTFQSVSSTNPLMTPLKGSEEANADGTKTVTFYYINIPSFPITFTYRVTTGTADSGALSISGLAKFRFTGAEGQSPAVITPVTAIPPAEGETSTEGESAAGSGCTGCNQTSKDLGVSLGDVFAAALALAVLLSLTRRCG